MSEILRIFSGFLSALILFPVLAGAQTSEPRLTTDFKDRYVQLFPCEFSVELKKSSIKGPARLKMISETVLPEITAVSLSSGQLISNEKYHSVTWTDLPGDSVIKLKFRITFPEMLTTEHRFDFIFSYNEGGTSVEKKLNSIQLNLLPPYSVNAKRKINQTGNNQYKILIEIEKPAAGGFARLFEKLPENASATDVESQGGAYKCEKGMVKFSWDDFLPENTSVTLSYVIRNTKEFPEITGSFSAEFLSGKYDNISIPTTEKNVLKTEIAITENKEIINTKEEVKTEPQILPEVTGIDNPVITKEDNKITYTGLSDTIFRIQFAASQPGVPESYFSKKYNISEKIYVEDIGGYRKFSIGEYSDFEEAVRKRNEWNKTTFKNPFIIAIVNGKRVPFDQNKKK